MENNNLEFTGERFTPECVREIWYEHYHRYAFAKNFVENKIVLDAACGEGYGGALLSDYAKHVSAIDIDKTSIEHAKNRYKKENLEYIQTSVLTLPFENNSFDVIVSFETLEHLAEHNEMISEFNRVLKKNGILIISTPDKKHYSDEAGFTNEFHVKELYKQEFEDLLHKKWKNLIWYAQALSFSSILEKIEEKNKERDYCTDVLSSNILESNQRILKEKYYIVIASNEKQKKIKFPKLHIFSDKEQTVYEHYNKTIRDYIYLANKYNEMIKRQEKWLSIPILGKIIKFLIRD